MHTVRATHPRRSHAPGSKPRGVSRARPSAFTLIELVAVMAILAILSAVVTPAALTLSTGRHAAAARTVARDLAFARARAMATGTTTWVLFDTSANAYSILAENPDSPGFAGAAAVTDPATGSPMVIRLNTGELAGTQLVAAAFAGNSRLGFDRRGRPLSSAATLLPASGTISISGSHTVTVTTPTGRITTN